MSGSEVFGRVTGRARLAGIVGLPVAHSLSPVIHNGWLEALGLDASYAAFAPVDPAGFETLIAAGRAGLIRGLNVTAPYKEQAFASADSFSDVARRAGSANLLVFDQGRVHADSTDGQGLIAALAEQAPTLSLQGGLAVVLGAGGAARAAAAALVDAGAQVRIVNRSTDRALALATDLGSGVEVASLDQGLEAADLVVNALSVQPDLDLGRLHPRAVLMDMTYRPVETAFLKAGRDRGLTGVDGLAMLIGQAVPSFKALFGVDPPGLDIRALLLGHLETGA